jgi:protein-L-isoaspartate(D-aspartate) O-methyltransferase
MDLATGTEADMTQKEQDRAAMLAWALRCNGIRDPRVLLAIRTVPRSLFVREDLVEHAYADTALPIEEGQTISQPYIVALMAEALELKPTDRVLEIGTGSGYGAAVLSRIAGEVFTVERIESLARTAARRLRRPGYTNVHVRHGDGTLGWPEHAPYDAIAVTAAAAETPGPLLEQLAPGGRLVIPIGTAPDAQMLVRIRKEPDGRFTHEELEYVRFVPLIGAEVRQPALV